jgi:hypothetical protein
MKSVPYASAIGILIYAQVCTCPHLSFVIRMLDRCQKNSGKSHWNGIKKALRYIQDTKGLMLMYERSDSLQIMRDAWILINLHQVMYSNLHVELYHGVAPRRVLLCHL